jgi:ADP-ribose pyrophosphatase YjhB (NUDIX family)
MHPGSRVDVEHLVNWADRLQSLARTGLFFAQTDYDRERYQQIAEIAAEMAGLLTDRSPLEFQTLWANDPGYATPRVGVGGAIFDERGQILLLERLGAEAGLWSLPVGFSEVGETPAEGIARELHEETGLLVSVDRLLGVYDSRGPTLLHHLYSVIFLCSIQGGTLTATAEAPVSGYFSRDALPPLLPHHVRPVMDAFTAHHDGWSGAAFDRPGT